jgi:lipid A 3-O-deacylase
MCRSFVAVLALALLASVPAHAAASSQPDLISLGGGYMNFDKDEPKRQSADFRLEYRFGVSLLPLISSSFAGGDQALQFHPFLGYETTTRNMQYGLGGLSMDWEFSKHGIFTWNEGVGYLDSGDMASMGGTLQFRSQAEIGYRFDNDMRITAQFSHISNAKLTRVNPGAEILGVYFHVPVRMLIGG